MQQHHVLLLSVFHQPGQAGHHFVFVLVRFAFGHKEAEHADVPRAEHLAQGHHILEHFKMGLEIIGDLDLADGGADGGNMHALGVQLRLEDLGLFGRIGLNAAAIHAANFNGLHTAGAGHFQLFVKILVNLIGKTGQNQMLHCRFILPVSCFFKGSGLTASFFYSILSQMHAFPQALFCMAQVFFEISLVFGMEK